MEINFIHIASSLFQFSLTPFNSPSLTKLKRGEKDLSNRPSLFQKRRDGDELKSPKGAKFY